MRWTPQTRNQLPPGHGISVSDTEPRPIIEALVGCTPEKLPEEFGVDYMFEVPGGFGGIQRKQFPEDFLASLRAKGHSGNRLAREFAQMKSLDVAFLLIEGLEQWTADGKLYGTRWDYTEAEWFGFQLSTMVWEGIPILRTKDMRSSVRLILKVREWLWKTRHGSLTNPSKPKSQWGDPNTPDMKIYALGGLPGINDGRAEKLLRHFGSLRRILDKDSDLTEVAGIGPKLADGINRFLDGEVVFAPEESRNQAGKKI